MSDFQPPPYPQNDSKDVQDNKVMAILAYIIFFIPLLVARNSPFAMYHANQGLTLFLVAVAANLVFSIIPFLGLLLPFVSLAIFAFMIIGIVNASKGERKPLPLMGNVQLLK